MAKITIDPIAGQFASTAAINSKFQQIEDELNTKVLYRSNPSGEPNSLTTDVDSSGQRILNLVDAVDQSEPVTLRQLNGAALVSSVASLKETYTATSGQTVFPTAATYVPGSNNLTVYVNGVKAEGLDYVETNGNTITFVVGLILNTRVEFNINERTVVSDVIAAGSITYTPTGFSATNVDAHLKAVDLELDAVEIRTATTAELAAIADSINTTNKQIGSSVFNTTLDQPVWAIGAASGSLWHFADGTVAHTPV